MKKRSVLILALTSVLLSTGCSDNAGRYDNGSAEMKNIIVQGLGSIDGTGFKVYHQEDYVQEPEKESVVDTDEDMDINEIYLADIDIEDEKKVGDWIYFQYMMEETYHNDTYSYPVLFRYQENSSTAQRVTMNSCYFYEVAGELVYYLESLQMPYPDHGVLYVSEPDGKNKRMLEEELYYFQIVDEQYIYYTYRHDTIGVGLEGHALHRMNLDGSDKMVAAYEVSGIDGGDHFGGHFGYRVVDGWVDSELFRMELGAPADGYEKIVFKDIGDNDWVYYVTNRLMKARKDGSERTELDGEDDYDYVIEKIDGDWIYYRKSGVKYRIRTDGSGKEMVR